ncbi:chorismate mutase [Streptococcus sp. 27098_8_75]|uniref:chorismate mutase n=1 Tax=Streptococcus sp. 27098_8_75 TaxID=3003667 RepID=UPI00352CBBE6
MNLEELRQEINQIDDELVVLLEKRMKLVNQVATYKQETGKAVLDTKREEVILCRVADHVENPAYKNTILATFKDILKNSRAYQEQKKA